MFSTKLPRLFQIVLLLGILLSLIEIASAQFTGGSRTQLVEGDAILLRQGEEIRLPLAPYRLSRIRT